MKCDDQWVMRSTNLDRTLTQKAPRVVSRESELADTREHNESDNGMEQAQAASSSCNPTLKPGPSADIRYRPERASAMVRSSTNRTVAADILP